jgi:HlyD family secretion protein
MHRPPRALLAVPILLLLGAVGWGAMAAPWAHPAGDLTASGTLEADEVLVGPEVSGQIVEIVQEGQTVAAGQVLARLDDSLIQLQYRQADVATRQQLDIQLERYQLQSPIPGVVTRVPMHAGEVVAPGQTIAAVANLRRLKLTVYVLERDLGQVQVGQQVAVTADPFGSRVFDGTVISTNPRAEFTPRNVQTQRDRLNLVFGVKVLVDNPDGALKPGMPADAAFSPQR